MSHLNEIKNKNNATKKAARRLATTEKHKQKADSRFTIYKNMMWSTILLISESKKKQKYDLFAVSEGDYLHLTNYWVLLKTIETNNLQCETSVH